MSAKRHLNDLVDGINAITEAVDALRREVSPDKKSRFTKTAVEKGVGTTAEPLEGYQALYRFKDDSYAVVKCGMILNVSYDWGDKKDVPGMLYVTDVHSDDGSCDGVWLYSYDDIAKEAFERAQEMMRKQEFRRGLYAISDCVIERFDVAFVVGVSNVKVYHQYAVKTQELSRIEDRSAPLTRHEEAFRDFLVIVLKVRDRASDIWLSTFGKRVIAVVPLLKDLMVEVFGFHPVWKRKDASQQGTCDLCKKGKSLTWDLFDLAGSGVLASYGGDCKATYDRTFLVRDRLIEMAQRNALHSEEYIRKKYKEICYDLKLDEEPYETSPVLPSSLRLAVNTAAAPPMPVAIGPASSSSSSAAAAAAVGL